MSENGTVAATEETSNATTETAETTNQETAENVPAETSETIENSEDISYHTVEKEGTVTAIWEMQGRKHIRTIDPRSSEGKQILELFENAT
jgi:hypothetical protein